MTRSGPTVLIADDSELFAAALEAMLSGEEIPVLGSAENGEEALRLARTLRPEVVLMDISMPVLDGFEAARRIREELPGTAVLMLTGSAAEADMEQALAAGACGYVTKDRMALDLLGAIREAVRRSSLS